MNMLCFFHLSELNQEADFGHLKDSFHINYRIFKTCRSTSLEEPDKAYIDLCLVLDKPL